MSNNLRKALPDLYKVYDDQQESYPDAAALNLSPELFPPLQGRLQWDTLFLP